MIDEKNLDELLALADKVPRGPYRAYKDGGSWIVDNLEGDWTNRPNVASDMATISATDCRQDGCESIAGFIVQCSPETIIAMVKEIRESRKALEICRDNPRDEDAEKIAHLEEFVAAMRNQAVSTPAESSQDYRDGYEAQGNWIAHHLRVLDQSQ